MKRHPPPYALSLLLLLAPLHFQAVTAAAQTAGRVAQPTRNIAGALGARARAKRVAPLRAGDAPGGSRVTVTADAALSDYSAYRRGEDFHILIPQAEAEAARHAVGGRGFSASRVEQVGGDLLLTFRLEAGAAVRVRQNFNRLDIVFTSKNQPPAAETYSHPTARPAAAGQEDERLKQVLKRVEELEARVRELEARQPAAAENSNGAAAPAAASAAAHAPQAATPQVAEDSSPRGGPPDDAHASDARAAGLPTGTPRMQIQGYADVNLRASDEPGRTTSFALGQLDLFITSRLSENFSVLGELILEAEEDNSFSFRAHRLLLRYAPREYFILGVGRDHTSIGFYNTAYHHGSWFQIAATRPYLFAFENKGGILPLHNVGVSVSGRIPSGRFGLRYVAEVGNGRSVNAPADRSVASTADENNGKAFNLALAARPPRLPGFQTGFSVYRDRRTPAGAANVGETIMAAHLVYRSSRHELLSEGLLVRHAAGARVFYTPGFYTQLSRRFGDARPYFRYQYVNAPGDDPIFRPLEVGRRDGPSLGLRYDVSEFAALKMQYDRTRRRRRPALNELTLQLAFTF